MKRILALLPVLLAFQVCVSPALAWTWPVSGPVLRPFAFDRGNPYAGGQHRGADIGASVGANRRRAGGRNGHVRREHSRRRAHHRHSNRRRLLRHARTPRLTRRRARCCRAGRCRSSARSARPGRPSSARRTFTSACASPPTSTGTSIRSRSFRGDPLHLRRLSLPQVRLRRSPAARPLRSTGRPRRSTAGRNAPRLSRGRGPREA